VTALVRGWWARIRIEVLLLTRDRLSLTFTIILPFVLLFTLASLIPQRKLPFGVSFAQYLTAGMIASGLVYGGFQSLSIALPDERADGTLKRLHGSPMRGSSYFAGKVGGVVATYVLQMALMLTLGGLVFHVRLPAGGGHLLTFLWLSALGLVTFTTLGIAFSSLAKTGQAAAAIATPFVLFLQFTSGVFFIYTQEPRWMQVVASIFPLRWLAQGMRSVFLPAAYGHAEVNHSFQLPLVALMLSIWSVIGLVLCWRTFRWMPLDEA
jgi:ABC-2 type transport system permease protein